ncbi:WD40 domain-containing protein [Acaryochloris marina]|nr:pentapeptide repeat-containing protein [Acaryochloris marina]
MSRVNFSTEISPQLKQKIITAFYEKYRKSEYSRLQISKFLHDWEQTISEKVPSDQTIHNFLNSKYSSYKYWLVDGLCRLLLGQPYDQLNLLEPLSETQTRIKHARCGEFRCNWGDAPDVSIFFGRTRELSMLQRWIVDDHCRLVAIVGIRGSGKTHLSVKLGHGGVGKTDLSLKLANGIQEDFDFVFWGKLLNAPPLRDYLTEVVKFLSHQQETELPGSEDKQISRLLYYLQSRRCLLILDNFESILQGGEQAGNYRQGFEGYGQLVQKIRDVNHQSCLLLTSREKPRDIRPVTGGGNHIQCLELQGLSVEEAHQLLTQLGEFTATDKDWEHLLSFYDGNPLALELAANHINEVFNGSISAFLREGRPIFDDLKQLLDWHFERLSWKEQEVVYWLALHREPVSISTLRTDLLRVGDKWDLPSTLQNLKRRLPLEKSSVGFTLQPVLIEYLTDRIIRQVIQELETNALDIFNRFALCKPVAKDYLRKTQARLILEPIAQLFAADQRPLLQFFQYFREHPQFSQGYAASNCLHLLRWLQADLSGCNLSQLTFRQADFQGMTLHQIDLTGSDFRNCTFTQSFGAFFSVAFSSDGQSMVTGGNDGQITIWDMHSYQPLKILQGTGDWVWCVTFTPDAQYLVSGSDDSKVRVWSVESGECLRVLSGHRDRVWSLDISPDGQTLATVSDDNTLKLWSLDSGACLRTINDVHGASPKSICFSPHEETLATGSEDGTVKLWDIRSGQCLWTGTGHSNMVNSVTFSPDGNLLASAAWDNAVMVWSIRTRSCLAKLQGHQSIIWDAAFSPDGKWLASSDHQGVIRIWKIASYQCFRTIQAHASVIWGIAFSPDSQLLVSSGGESMVKLWRVDTGVCQQTLQGYINRTWSVSFHPNGQTLANGHEDGTLQVWDIHTGHNRQVFRGHQNWLWGVAFSHQGQILASACQDGVVKVWSYPDGHCLHSIEHGNRVFPLAFSPDGKWLATGCDDSFVRLLSVASGECLKQLIGHTNRIWGLAFSPSGHIMASGSDDLTVRLWYLESEESLVIDVGTRVRSVAFSPDGQILASGSDYESIQLWSVEMRKCIRELPGHKQFIWSVAFSPDGECLASASQDQTARLWSLETGECLQIFQGHTARVISVEFSPDGQTIATASDDGSVKLWDLHSAQCIRTFRPSRPYEKTNISRTTGLTDAQKSSLITLGAVDDLFG